MNRRSREDAPFLVQSEDDIFSQSEAPETRDKSIALIR
jgi:hypothetical protein